RYQHEAAVDGLERMLVERVEKHGRLEAMMQVVERAKQPRPMHRAMKVEEREVIEREEQHRRGDGGEDPVARRVPVTGAPARRERDAGADDGVEEDAVAEDQRQLAGDHLARLALVRLMGPPRDVGGG